MNRRPSNQELDRLLAELPRESASPGFSGRVLTGLDAPARARTGLRWLLAAAGTAAALSAGLLLLPRATSEPPLAETRALQEEHRLLMEELESLKASLRASEAAPVLYLGGNEHLDLVLDLGPVWRSEPAGDVRPAVYGGAENLSVATDRRGGGNRR